MLDELEQRHLTEMMKLSQRLEDDHREQPEQDQAYINKMTLKVQKQRDCIRELEAKTAKLESLSTRYARLKANCIIDTANFTEWKHAEVSDWIVSLDNGAYDKNESVLREKLAQMEIDGASLLKCSKSDIEGFGIRHKGHQNAIWNHIQTLHKQLQPNKSEKVGEYEEEKMDAEEKPQFTMRKEIKALDLKEEEMNVKVQVGTLVKAAATVAAGAATGGIGATMGLVDALKGVELEMSFGKSKSNKDIVKHYSDNDHYLFLKIEYSSTKKKTGVLGFRKTKIEVTGTIYVAYMEALNEPGRRRVQALTKDNADSVFDFVRDNIRDQK